MNLINWAWAIIPLGMTRILQVALHDRVLRGPRRWLLRKLNPQGLPMGHEDRPYWSFMLECPWCLSMWLAIGCVAALLCDATRDAALAVLLVTAISLMAVVIDRLVDKFTPDQPPPAPAPAPPSPPVPPHVAAAFDQLTGDETDGTS